MRGRRIVVAAAVGLVAMIGATGCGSSGTSSNSAPDAPAARPESANQGGAGQGGSGQGGAADQGTAQQPVSADQRAVIRTAQLSIRVDDIAAAARTVAAVGPRFGGYVAEEDVDNSRATVRLKIESTRLDEALTVLTDDVGEVGNRSQQATDVTEQTVDLQARIAAQRASVDRVRTLLANASTVGEIVEIESELTTRQAELDSLEQRLAALSGQTDLADVTVTLYKSSTPIAADEEDTGFLAGLAAGWGAFTWSMQVGLTVLGVVLPFAIALAIPVALLVWLVRRSRKPVQRPAPAPAGPPTG